MDSRLLSDSGERPVISDPDRRTVRVPSPPPPGPSVNATVTVALPMPGSPSPARGRFKGRPPNAAGRRGQ
eukprot:747107-Hanusia_phi.AAC.5